jgi:hypothetical protein
MTITISKDCSAHRTKSQKPYYPIKSQSLSSMRDIPMRKNLVNRLSSTRALTFLFCISMTMSAMFAALPTAIASSQVTINLKANNSSYYTMQTVGLYANLTTGGTPKFDGILAVEVDQLDPLNPSQMDPILYRSVRSSQTPNPALFNNKLNITSVTPVKDLYTWTPTQGFTRGTLSYFGVTINNTGPQVQSLITATIFDSASTPVTTGSYGTRSIPWTITPGITIFGFSLYLRTWASVGTATVYINIFSGSPSIYGNYPLTPEKSAPFKIYGRTQATSSLEPSTAESYPDIGSISTSINGAYNLSWRFPPYTEFGDYMAFASANYTSATPGYASTEFQVAANPSQPPEANFMYSPSAPYEGGTTYFDASASFSYNGTITNYRWNWGDGSSQTSTSSPVTTHVFNSNGTFLVTLNVTDSQNLWSIAQKPVPVSGPTPPVASFTFTPSPTWINASTTFDASASSPGWNGTGHPPIVNYAWNFGDGTSVVNTPNPVTHHQFTALGNFTTTLTVSDTRGWTGQTSKIVQVANVTQHPEIAVTNVTLAPLAPQPTPYTGVYEIAPNYYEPYKGWTGSIKVTVLNNGTSAESFSVTVYYSNGTSLSLGTQSVTNLASQDSVLLTFAWSTTLFKPSMNYTITANATILFGELNIQNNEFSIVARVKGLADLNGDGKVSGADLNLLGINWGRNVPPANPRADANEDGKIAGADLNALGINWGKIY